MVVSDATSAATLPFLKSVFDCKKIVKISRRDGPIFWKCIPCGESFSGNNTTKSLLHVLKVCGQYNIKACTAEILPIFLCCYKELYTKKYLSKLTKDEVMVSQAKMVEERHERVASFVRPLLKNSKSPHNKKQVGKP